MRHYFVFELQRFLKDTKTLFMILTLFTFFCAVFYGIHSQGLGDQERKLAEELNQTRILSQYAQQYNRENEEAFALSSNLSQQQAILASQANGITFEHPDWYIESGLELAQLRLEMHKNDSFSELPSSLLPKEDRMYRDLVELEAIDEHSIPIMENSKSAAGFIRESLFLFGLLAFGYLLVFASDILMDDFEHGTMLKSYPITPFQKYVSKLIIYSMSVVVVTALVMGLAATIVSLVWGIGNFNYPIGIYISGDFRAIPLWESVLLFFLYYFVLAVHTFLLAMVLNQFLKNSIATIIVGLVLSIIPYLSPPIAYYLPFYYYNMTYLLNGQFAIDIGRFIDLGRGMVILSLYSILLIYLVFRKDKQQTTI